MHAMILAAGRGVRMLPLTDKVPKPLLQINGKPLIQYHVENLVRAGIREIVINHAVMGEQIEAYLGDGRKFGVKIRYSAEGDMPLETGGGILQVLPMLGDQPFIAINADIWTDYPLQNLPQELPAMAHLVLVKNPAHHPGGDFCLADNGLVLNHDGSRFTFSGIGVYRPELFSECEPGSFPLGPLLRHRADRGQIRGELYTGLWTDVGTPERLDAVRELSQK